MHEGDVLCLLDFYVHIRLQRQGIGAKLFTAALQVCRQPNTTSIGLGKRRIKHYSQRQFCSFSLPLEIIIYSGVAQYSCSRIE